VADFSVLRPAPTFYTCFGSLGGLGGWLFFSAAAFVREDVFFGVRPLGVVNPSRITVLPLRRDSAALLFGREGCGLASDVMGRFLLRMAIKYSTGQRPPQYEPD
jgi:hypothetical protein